MLQENDRLIELKMIMIVNDAKYEVTNVGRKRFGREMA